MRRILDCDLARGRVSDRGVAPTADEPLISVIIPVFDDREGLRACLQALARQTLPAERFEVLVVDNGSRTSPADLVESHPFARLVEEPTPGSYAARNRGLVAARGRLLAFTDADCEPAPSWLEAGACLLESHAGPVVVAGRVEVVPHDPARPTLAEEYELAFAFTQQDNAARKHFSVTANLLTTREVFDRVGPFDAGLKSGGDKEWGQRAFRSGVPVVYCHAAVVRHAARRSLGELCRKRARQVGGLLLLSRKKYPGWLAVTLAAGKQAVPKVLVPPAREGQSLPARVRRYAKVVAAANVIRAYGLLEVVRLSRGKAPRR